MVANNSLQLPTSQAARGAQTAWEQMLCRAATDSAFRSRLHANPLATLRECGVDLSAGTRVTVVEFDPQHLYLVLPPMTGNEAQGADTGI